VGFVDLLKEEERDVGGRSKPSVDRIRDRSVSMESHADTDVRMAVFDIDKTHRSICLEAWLAIINVAVCGREDDVRKNEETGTKVKVRNALRVIGEVDYKDILGLIRDQITADYALHTVRELDGPSWQQRGRSSGGRGGQ
jgi:hypothetical protein